MFVKKYTIIIAIAFLAVITLSFLGYFFWNENQKDQKITEKQTQYIAVDTSESTLQRNHDFTIIRLDSLIDFNTRIENELAIKSEQITRLRGQIVRLQSSQLNRFNSISADKSQAILNRTYDFSNLINEESFLSGENGHISESDLLQSKIILGELNFILSENGVQTAEIQSLLQVGQLLLLLIELNQEILKKSSSLCDNVYVDFVRLSLNSGIDPFKAECINVQMVQWKTIFSACEGIRHALLVYQPKQHSVELEFARIYSYVNLIEGVHFKGIDFDLLKKGSKTSINDYLQLTVLGKLIDEYKKLFRLSNDFNTYLVNRFKEESRSMGARITKKLSSH